MNTHDLEFTVYAFVCSELYTFTCKLKGMLKSLQKWLGHFSFFCDCPNPFARFNVVKLKILSFEDFMLLHENFSITNFGLVL